MSFYAALARNRCRAVVNRNRLPAPANRAIDWIADHPNGIIGSFAARRYGTPVAGTAVSTFSLGASTRVLITPVNYSGQATAWAAALEREHPTTSARTASLEVPGGFDFPSDLVIPLAVYHNDHEWQQAQFEAACSATHVLIEAEEPPFGRLLGRSTAAQSAALITSGVDVAFMAHGTDIRLPSRHRAVERWSHYADDRVYAPRAEQLAQRNLALLRASGRPLFVSTPDLLLDLPEAVWCPVVVNPAQWAHPRSPRAPGSPLRVAHAPSVTSTKGTELIMPTLRALEADGVIELALAERIPAAQMPEFFARADVVLDQFRIGSYGVAACEAIAAGCVVVGHVADAVRETVSIETGRDLPIVQADPDSLEQVLRSLGDPSYDLTAEASRGRTFVETVHDGRVSAERLRRHWIDAPTDHDSTTNGAA